MIKKIIILFIIIYFLMIPLSYATDAIISSQMEALDLSSFIKEGEAYTQEIFSDIDFNEFFNSAIRGQIDNKVIAKGILSVFGDEIVSAISLLGTVLIVVIIHSLLKNFTDNLNNGEGIGQIAYYVEYILIVTLIMANFSNIINMIKESISNLVGFVNSLVPILLALMAATRKRNISIFSATFNNICNSIYWKHDKYIDFTDYINCNCYWNNF